MPDKEKTKEQLQQEIDRLLSKVVDLEVEQIKRKQAEDELWESERRFLRLLDGLPLAVFVLDAQGKPYYQNKAFRELLGKGMDPLTKAPFAEIFQAYLAGTDQVYPTERLPLMRALAGESTTVEDMEIRRPDRTLLVEVTGSPIFDAQGNVKYAVAVFDDITERKRAQEALKKQQAYFQQLFESSPESIVLVNHADRILQINPGFEKLFQYTLDEVRGRPINEVIIPEQLTEEGSQLSHRALRGEVTQKETVRRRKDGSLVEVSILGYPIAIEGNVVGVYGVYRDISERKRAEEALRKSEGLNRAVIQNSPVGITVRKWSGELVLYNEAWKKIWALTEEEIQANEHRFAGRTFEERYPHLRQWAPDAGNLFESGGELLIPEVETKSTKPVAAEWVSTRFYALQNAEGKVEQVVTLTEDISARKKIEGALRQSEERYRSLMDNLNVGVYRNTPGPRGKFIEVNPALVTMFGYSDKEQLFEINVSDLYEHPEDRTQINEKLLRSGFVRNEALRLKKQDGTPLWAAVTAVAVRDEDGTAKYYDGIIEDISERKQAETALKESEDRFRRLSDVSREGIAVHSRGIILDANRAFAERFGYELAEIIGKNVLDLAAPESRDLVLRNVQSGSEKPYEAVGLRKDGSTFVGELQSKSISSQGRTARVTAIYDITERKRAEEELRASIDRLQRITESAIQALGMMVEMKDPYTAGHQLQVATLACAIAEEMELSRDQIEGLRFAARIHDVGKIQIPAEILTRPGPLNENEITMIRMHPKHSYDILKTIDFPWPVAEIALQHHEKLDGSGYPQGLTGDEILLEARILGVADVVASIAFHRPYRPGHGIKKALEEIAQNRGTRYDGQVVDACLRLFTEKGFNFE